MARPQSVTDDVILQTAQLVLERRGHDGFTLSEVAEEVGLSRAAITLRFKSALVLKVRLLEKSVERFTEQLDRLPSTPSGDNLIEIAAFLGQILAQRPNFGSVLAVYSGNIKIGDLAVVELRRRQALRDKIFQCMPNTALPRQQTADAFEAHLGGTIMATQGQGFANPCEYLIERTRQWLNLAQIPYSPVYEGLWMTAPPPGPPKDPPPRTRRPR